MWSKSNKRPETVTFEADAELVKELHLAANAQRKRPEELLTELVARGLEKSAVRQELEDGLETLTPKEREVLRLIVRGLTNRQIADRLFVTSETVKTHVRHILVKLRVDSKVSLRLLLLDLGMRVWNEDSG